MLEELEKALKTHDWYFHYSDDHRYYTRGKAERDQIDRLINKAYADGFGEEARQLFNDLSPSDFHMKERI